MNWMEYQPGFDRISASKENISKNLFHSFNKKLEQYIIFSFEDCPKNKKVPFPF